MSRSQKLKLLSGVLQSRMLRHNSVYFIRCGWSCFMKAKRRDAAAAGGSSNFAHKQRRWRGTRNYSANYFESTRSYGTLSIVFRPGTDQSDAWNLLMCRLPGHWKVQISAMMCIIFDTLPSTLGRRCLVMMLFLMVINFVRSGVNASLLMDFGICNICISLRNN